MPSASDTQPSPTTASARTDTLVDIGGGVRLRLRCSDGPAPTVVMDADFNGDMSEFDLVMPKLAGRVRACAYDRAGEGSSTAPARAGRTSADIARELHALLTTAGIPSPYVLVGNHFGGLFDLRYATLYPGDVSGLVLLDPFLPTAFMQFHADCHGISNEPNVEQLDICALLKEAAAANLRAPTVPLEVVSAIDNPGWSVAEFSVWQQSHRDLVASVPVARQVMVHIDIVIPREHPDVTVEAIEDVLFAMSHPGEGFPAASP